VRLPFGAPVSVTINKDNEVGDILRCVFLVYDTKPNKDLYPPRLTLERDYDWSKASYVYISDCRNPLPAVIDPSNLSFDKPETIENILDKRFSSLSAMVTRATSGVDEKIKAKLEGISNALTELEDDAKAVQVCRIDGSNTLSDYTPFKTEEEEEGEELFTLARMGKRSHHGVYIDALPGR
jgi:hypothetical protein